LIGELTAGCIDVFASAATDVYDQFLFFEGGGKSV
jgi:hypothetical protein